MMGNGIVAKCTGTSGAVPELSDLQRTAPELLLSLLFCTGAASSAIYSRVARVASSEFLRGSINFSAIKNLQVTAKQEDKWVPSYNCITVVY